MTVNGELIKGLSSFPVVNPATGELIAEAPSCDVETLNLAVASAHEAFPVWSQRADRAELLLECARRLKGETMQLARLLT
ncbi:MAG: aldehyde dehydrogenase family protein, partial [Verrucomicrobiales bacterium]